MDIKLIQGDFSPNDASDLITQMIHVKIKYHENKIESTSNEEDIKMREKRIKELQKQLFDLRKYIDGSKKNISINSDIKL